MGKNLAILFLIFRVVLCDQNQICEVSTCLRKCCPKAQYLVNRTCHETQQKFNFSDIGVNFDIRIQDGIVKCRENEARFLLESYEFLIKNNNLQWSVVNATIHYSRYCVDMIEDFAAPKALVCYKEAVQEFRVHHSSGKETAFLIVHQLFLEHFSDDSKSLHWS